MYRNPLPRRAVADEDVPQAILKATIRHDTLSPQVSSQRAEMPTMIGLVVLFPGQQYYLVKDTTYINRFYVLTRNLRTGKWRCSYAGVARYCFEQVQEYWQEQRVLRQMRARVLAQVVSV